jgi:hypothetical protein
LVQFFSILLEEDLGEEPLAQNEETPAASSHGTQAT